MREVVFVCHDGCYRTTERVESFFITYLRPGKLIHLADAASLDDRQSNCLVVCGGYINIFVVQEP